MQIPVRLTVLLRPSVAPGVLLGVGFSTLVFSATPFLLDLVADEYDLGLTAASLVGVAQLGGFVLGTWGAGRWLRPRRRVFVLALVMAITVNLLSSTLPPFVLLLSLRLLSGLCLGLITWFAWVQVFGDRQGMADVAVVGPLVGVVTGPLIALFAVRGGATGVFALLGVAAFVPVFFNRGTGASHIVQPRGPRSTPVPAAMVLLGALATFTLGGSAVFQYTVVVGTDDVGLSTTGVAGLFSLNAAASVPAARWPWRRGLPGLWIALTGLCAFVVMSGRGPVLFGLAIIVWGFAFWMAIPGVFTVLAERSANPSDRAGDAQAVMAAGRVLGPFIGGLVIDELGTTWLGVLGGGTMILAGAAVFTVRTAVRPRDAQGAPTEVPAD